MEAQEPITTTPGIGRLAFIACTACLFGLAFAAAMVSEPGAATNLSQALAVLMLVPAGLRLRSAGMSLWWLLLMLIPGVNIGLIIALMIWSPTQARIATSPATKQPQ